MNSTSVFSGFTLSKQQLALCTENGAVIRQLVSRRPQDSFPRIKATNQRSSASACRTESGGQCSVSVASLSSAGWTALT